MMRFPVPQFINVEDKIAGPLTWKQLYWMIGMTVVLLVVWRALSGIALVISIILIVGIFGALAFYKPWGQPLLKMFWFALVFVFRPKIYLWKRMQLSQVLKEETPPIPPKKETLSYEKTAKQIKNYASLLENPERIKEDGSVTKEENHGILKLFSKSKQ